MNSVQCRNSRTYSQKQICVSLFQRLRFLIILAVPALVVVGAQASEDLSDSALNRKLDQLTAKFNEAISGPSTPLDELKAQYRDALQQHARISKEKGLLKDVIAATESIKELDDGSVTAGSKSPTVAKLKETYLSEAPIAKAKVRSRISIVRKQYAAALAEIVSDLTKADQIEDAKRVQKMVEKATGQSVDGTTDEGINEPSDDTATRSAERERLAHYLKLGYHRGAAGVISKILTTASLDSKELSRASGLLEQSLANHTLSCLRFENPSMAANALESYLHNEHSVIDPKTVAKLGAGVGDLKKKGPPLKWKAKDLYIKGNHTWSDQSRGTKINGVLQTGNCDNNRKGGWATAKVIVKDGCYIQGGTIRASHGRLEFQGTTQRPVILHNVRIECDYTAAVVAKNTIFIDCKFTKSGSWFWKGGFSSKWTFEDCLVAKSNFANLDRNDYGLRFKQTIFYKCSFPDRTLNTNPKSSAKDAYHLDWNQLSDCGYIECSFPPSLIWNNQQACYLDCEIRGESKLESSKPFEVTLGCSPTTFMRDLKAATSTTTGENLVYAEDLQVIKSLESRWWHLLPKID